MNSFQFHVPVPDDVRLGIFAARGENINDYTDGLVDVLESMGWKVRSPFTCPEKLEGLPAKIRIYAEKAGEKPVAICIDKHEVNPYTLDRMGTFVPGQVCRVCVLFFG